MYPCSSAGCEITISLLRRLIEVSALRTAVSGRSFSHAETQRPVGILADLYDRAHQPDLAAAFGPFDVLQRALAEVSMRAFGDQLAEAHEEREALIAELRDSMWMRYRRPSRR